MTDLTPLIAASDHERLHVLQQATDLADVDVTIPDADELLTRMLATGIPFEDLNPLISLGPRLAQPDAQELLRLCVGALVSAMGRPGEGHRLPQVADELSGQPGYTEIYIALLTLPYVRAYHARRGIDPQVGWRTLVDLGRNVSIYRQRRGHGGFDDLGWLRHHLTGCLYDLGRLQFERARLGNTFAAQMREDGLDAEPGEPVLSVHIPRYSGPIAAGSCDAAFARARTFFPEHFADETVRWFVCSSWLLDPVLAEELPGRSNIVAFQRRFRVRRQDEPDDAGTLLFVFGDPELPREAYPRTSSLERAVMGRLEAGGHWHGGRGWTAF